MIIKPVSSAITLSTTPNNVGTARLVRINATGAVEIIVADPSAGAVGSFFMNANTSEILEKEPLHTIALGSAISNITATAVSYKG